MTRTMIGTIFGGGFLAIRTNIFYRACYEHSEIFSLNLFDREGFYQVKTNSSCYFLYRNIDVGLFIATNLNFLSDSWIGSNNVHVIMTFRGDESPVIYRKIEPLEVLFL